MSTLEERLAERIRASGPLPFAVVMEEALYGAGGYYARRRSPIGEGGDFITGSSHSALFGRSTARLLGRLDVALGGEATLLEAGYGDGRHLAAVAAASPGRRLVGQDRIERPVPRGVERSAALSELPVPIDGLVFSYELFDALPVHRLVGREAAAPGELMVGIDGESRLAWVEGELSDPALAELLGDASLEPGQIADLSPGWSPLYSELAATLGRGLLVTCDYGYGRRRLLDPRVRRHGTLAAHRAHRVHRDVLRDLGEQDLTAHVDFTALRQAGEAAGLDTVCFTRQALWLTACGLFDDLDETTELELRQQAATLLDGEGMGEEIRVLVQARGIDPAAVLDLELLGGPEAL